jgi:hypothetical protein
MRKWKRPFVDGCECNSPIYTATEFLNQCYEARWGIHLNNNDTYLSGMNELPAITVLIAVQLLAYCTATANMLTPVVTQTHKYSRCANCRNTCRGDVRYSPHRVHTSVHILLRPTYPTAICITALRFPNGIASRSALISPVTGLFFISYFPSNPSVNLRT